MSDRAQKKLEKKARRHSEAGRYERALECYRKLCKAQRDRAEPWLSRGETAQRIGKSDEAAESFYRAGEILAASGDKQSANAALGRVLFVAPGHRQAVQLLTSLLARAEEASTEPRALAAAPAAEVVDRAAMPPVADAAPVQPTGNAPPPPAGDAPPQPADAAGSEAEGAESSPPPAVNLEIATAVVTHSMDSPRLSQLDSNAIKFLATYGDLIHVAAGEALFRLGDEADHILLLLDGSAVLTRPVTEGGPVVEVVARPGDLLGDEAILREDQHCEDARAETSSIVLRLRGDVMRDLLAKERKSSHGIARYLIERIASARLGAWTSFAHTSPEQTDQLARSCSLVEIPQSAAVVRQGEPVDGLYLVVAGELFAIYHSAEGVEAFLGSIGPGEVFGEMSIVSGPPARATVRATTRAWAVCVPRAEINALICADPLVLERLSTIAERRAEANRRTLAAIALGEVPPLP